MRSKSPTTRIKKKTTANREMFRATWKQRRCIADKAASLMSASVEYCISNHLAKARSCTVGLRNCTASWTAMLNFPKKCSPTTILWLCLRTVHPLEHGWCDLSQRHSETAQNFAVQRRDLLVSPRWWWWFKNSGAKWLMVGGGDGKDTQTHVLFSDNQLVVITSSFHWNPAAQQTSHLYQNTSM